MIAVLSFDKLISPNGITNSMIRFRNFDDHSIVKSYRCHTPSSIVFLYGFLIFIILITSGTFSALITWKLYDNQLFLVNFLNLKKEKKVLDYPVQVNVASFGVPMQSIDPVGWLIALLKSASSRIAPEKLAPERSTS